MPLAPRALLEQLKLTPARPSRRLHAVARPSGPCATDTAPARLLETGSGRDTPVPLAPHPAASYGALGSLEVRLARSRADVRAAQRLRYRVFFEEMSAVPSVGAKLRRRDEDPYDRLCDHLLVVDRAPPCASTARSWRQRRTPPIVGTYRILRQHVAERHRGFYTQGEFDLAPLLAARRDLEFMELGRSCVLASHRTKRTVELLWHGLWTYVREHRIDVMIGCASFEGIDPAAHALALSFLHKTALAPPQWRVQAHAARRQAMNLLPSEAIDTKAALKALPPLIKGYLRLGAYVGDGAVVDRQFGTTDVLIVLPVDRIDQRYFARFGAPDEQTSRLRDDAKSIIPG